jgi:hypothetical protein
MPIAAGNRKHGAPTSQLVIFERVFMAVEFE